MGLFGKIAGTIGENISKDKEQKEKEKAFVQNNEGSKAICAYIAELFEKGNSGYDWVKENRVGLFPVINSDSVSLCYMQGGDGKSFKTAMPKDVEVARYNFEEMYNWYGLEASRGYRMLDSRIQLNELESMINSKVQELPHIKYNNGYLVKMFN
jgi:hypothetical protein